MEVWPGNAYPLGATFDGSGTNFSLFSEAAESVELCLFGARGRETRVVMPENDGYVWHCYLPSVQPGQRYGYRVHGPYDPTAGLRCNPNKLLLDPYAKAVSGDFRWNNALFSYPLGDADAANRADAMDTADSARYMPKAVVINPYFDWTGDIHPRIRYDDTIIYEAHVKGLTMRHPDLPAEIRGTYAGIAHPAVVDHLTRLGVTAIELMPVHQFVQDSTLKDRGLANYWGYNTIGFFAPHNAYCSAGDTGGQVQEFKAMVKVLHSAGIEVILDVVYNHTAEGNQLGPTLSFRGIDNVNYYRLVDDHPEYYMDYTGTGNSLNVRSPHALQLLMDSLRYWVTEMHVDGFRFDLAATLAREFYDVDRLSSFFELVQQDPDRLPGQADRRTLGRGSGWLPGRQLPAAVDGVERQVPRHGPRLLARRAGHPRRVRLPAHRLRRPLRALRASPGRLDQLRHRPRRLHPTRPGVLQRETQRG